MKKRLLLTALSLFSLMLISCDRGGYTKTENGAMMKFFTENKNGEVPQIGDLVVLDLTQKISDSVIFASSDLDEPFEFIVEEPVFEGDIMCALLSMHLNDHASLVFPVDSLFNSIGEQVPAFIEPGTMTEMNIVLKEIVKKEVIEAELQAAAKELKEKEIADLSQYYNGQYQITEDSLIVLNINKGKGRQPNEGDIMKVYFTYQTLDGDTLLDFTIGEPYELVFGDKALGEGFYEALSLVTKGGEAEFIIPSSLAFGPEGFEGVILPYTPFRLSLKVVDVMTADEYEEEQKIKMEKENAERAKRLQEEPSKIANYLKKNNINVQPKESGLYYMETNAGDGASVSKGNIVTVNYIIYNVDGKMIESSYDYGQPISFVYGNSEMIPGIEEAVSYMKVGGTARLIVPSSLGFGEIKISDDLPANSILIIDLELVGLN